MSEKLDSPPTDTTDASFTSQRDPFDQPYFYNILESTKEIINDQAKQIFQLNQEIKLLKADNQKLKNQYDTLITMLEGKQVIHIDKLISKINQLENELVCVKTQLAIFKAQTLELKFVGKKASKLPNYPINLEILEIERLRSNIQKLMEKSKVQQESLTFQWNKMIQSFLVGFSKVGRFKEKTFQLAKKGIPNVLREKLWPIIFQNKLGITNSLYSELLKKKQTDKNYTKRVLWQINKDICRSFNGKTHFDQKIGLTTQVTQILQIFHMYRPDVSYVQGMTYPAIVLNLIVGKYKAFDIFSNLIVGNDFFRRLYTFEDKYLTCYCRVFDLLLKQKVPKVYRALQQRNIQSEIYLVQWFYTFFSRGLSYEFTLKIWDLLAYEQQLLFYKLGLSILQLLQFHILQSSGQEVIGVIRQYSSKITEIQLLQLLSNQKLNRDKLDKYFEKFFKKPEKNQ